MAHIAHYMVFHHFHARIWKQMQVYFAIHWQESKGMNEDELLRGLTTSVKQDITLHVKRDFVVQMKFFAKCDEAFIRAVIASLQQELFVRNDIIISEGDRGRSLYVIESGLVSVRILKKFSKFARQGEQQQQPEFEVIKGRYEFIGEKSLLFGIPRTATCVTICSCSVLILTLEKYEQVLAEFPEYREKNMRDWIFTRGGSKAPGTDAANANGVPASRGGLNSSK